MKNRVRQTGRIPGSVACLDVEKDGSALHSLRSLLALPNVTWSKRSMLDDIQTSDLMVSDGISIVGYWAATSCPMAVCRDDRSPRFNADGEELVADATSVASAEQLGDWLASTSEPGVLDKARLLHDICSAILPTFDHTPFAIWSHNNDLGVR